MKIDIRIVICTGIILLVMSNIVLCDTLTAPFGKPILFTNNETIIKIPWSLCNEKSGYIYQSNSCVFGDVSDSSPDDWQISQLKNTSVYKTFNNYTGINQSTFTNIPLVVFNINTNNSLLISFEDFIVNLKLLAIEDDKSLKYEVDVINSQSISLEEQQEWDEGVGLQTVTKINVENLFIDNVNGLITNDDSEIEITGDFESTVQLELNGIVTFKGDSTQTISGICKFKELIISNTQGVINISDNINCDWLVIDSGCKFTTNKNITVNNLLINEGGELIIEGDGFINVTNELNCNRGLIYNLL